MSLRTQSGCALCALSMVFLAAAVWAVRRARGGALEVALVGVGGLVLATDLAGLGGTDLPLEVSALDSFAAVTEGPERAISIVARVDVPLARIYLGQEVLCHVLDRAGQVAEFLLDRAPAWLDEI